ncbi:heme peroxidase family protein [Myceligenerans cantabricum]
MERTIVAPRQGETGHVPHEQVDLAETPGGRTVGRIGHGGMFLPAGSPADQADPATSRATLLPRTEQAVRQDLRTGRFDATTPFDYLLAATARDYPLAHLPALDPEATKEALQRLGAGMVESADPGPRESTIPVVYTYWGQFVDHDVTLFLAGAEAAADEAAADGAAETGEPQEAYRGPGRHPGAGHDGPPPLGDIVDDPFEVFSPGEVRRRLRNARRPLLDLDSLYGSGPRFPGEKDHGGTRSEAAYVPGSAKLRLGRLGDLGEGFTPVAPAGDQQRDLPRDADGHAIVPDARNDENMLVAQFHVAMIRFHNAVVDWLAEHRPRLARRPRDLFTEARELVRHHYQWLLVHDFLRTLTKPGVLDAVLADGARLFHPARRVAMPVEFAAAAFRFGHSLVRETNELNVNFSTGAPSGPATLGQLFTMTGGGGLSADPSAPGTALPAQFAVDWTRLTDHGDPNPDHMSRRLDPFVADGLANLRNEGNGLPDRIRGLLKHLAQRNLLRGYQHAVPTGEAAAAALGVTPLTHAELRRGATPEVAAALDELGATPLWYYVLKEADVQGNGNFLGDVGSRVLAETFVYLLQVDDDAYTRRHGGAPWSPASGVRLDDGRPITTIVDLLRFAGVHPVGVSEYGEPEFRRHGAAGHDGAS